MSSASAEKKKKEPTLFDACKLGDVARVTKYVEGRGSPNDTDQLGMTLLHHAASGGHPTIIGLLLGLDAIDVDKKDSSGWAALHFAADGNHVEAMKVLLDDGAANLNCRDECKRTPLHMACNSGAVEAVKELVERRAALNAKNIAGWTPLRCAEEHKHKEVIALLAEAGAKSESS